jgi:hypothetical protein
METYLNFDKLLRGCLPLDKGFGHLYFPPNPRYERVTQGLKGNVFNTQSQSAPHEAKLAREKDIRYSTRGRVRSTADIIMAKERIKQDGRPDKSSCTSRQNYIYVIGE